VGTDRRHLGNVEDVDWLMKKYRQVGLTDVHSQTVNFFYPQWAPESWEVTATAGGKTLTLTSAQPPYGAVSTNGKALDLPAVYVGLGSEADYVGRDAKGRRSFSSKAIWAPPSRPQTC